jgi:hypothetical protein
VLQQATPASPSRKLNSHRSGFPTDNPHRRYREKEEDSPLHTNEAKNLKAKA